LTGSENAECVIVRSLFKTQQHSVSLVACLTTKHVSKAVKYLTLAFLSQVFKVWITKMLLH